MLLRPIGDTLYFNPPLNIQKEDLIKAMDLAFKVIDRNMNNKERIESFMKEYEELCIRHGLSLGHEDYEGGFIIDEYDADNVEWVKAAMNGFELREKRQKEVEEILHVFRQ